VESSANTLYKTFNIKT